MSFTLTFVLVVACIEAILVCLISRQRDRAIRRAEEWKAYADRLDAGAAPLAPGRLTEEEREQLRKDWAEAYGRSH